MASLRRKMWAQRALGKPSASLFRLKRPNSATEVRARPAHLDCAHSPAPGVAGGMTAGKHSLQRSCSACSGSHRLNGLRFRDVGLQPGLPGRCLRVGSGSSGSESRQCWRCRDSRCGWPRGACPPGITGLRSHAAPAFRGRSTRPRPRPCGPRPRRSLTPSARPTPAARVFCAVTAGTLIGKVFVYELFRDDTSASITCNAHSVHRYKASC